jgi:predicted RNA-binding protein with PUA domain
MAEDPVKLEVTSNIAKVTENLNTEPVLVTDPTVIDAKKSKTAVADAYLAGYEIGYIDGKNEATANPEKGGDLKIEPMRLTLPWWP